MLKGGCGCPKGLWNSWERTCSCVLNQSMVFCCGAWGGGNKENMFECDVWRREFEGFNGDKTQIWRVIIWPSFRIKCYLLPFKVKEWWCCIFSLEEVILVDSDALIFICIWMQMLVARILQVHTVGMFYSISCFSCFSAFQVWWNMGLLASKLQVPAFWDRVGPSLTYLHSNHEKIRRL